tara:strand:- start:73 stop:213 length:141 start_codon:yes stop_codon:yes gene_type:complete
MIKIIIGTLVAIIISGCAEKSAGEICQETSILLKEKQGKGFTVGRA